MITLPTSADVRAKLAAKGWERKPANCMEVWDHKCGLRLYLVPSEEPSLAGSDAVFNLSVMTDLASILGIGGIGQQEGVMIPLEDVIDLANYTAFAASKTGTASAKELAERTTRRYLATLSATQPPTEEASQR